jgi:hypothetical protein
MPVNLKGCAMPSYRTCNESGAMTYLGWTLGVVVVIVLVYLGCTAMSRPPPPYPPPPSNVGAMRSARRSGTAGSTMNASQQIVQGNGASVPIDEVANYTMKRVDNGSSMNWGSAEHDTKPALTGLPTEGCSESHPDFMNLGVDDAKHASQFQPVDKAGAKKGANQRPAMTTLSSRDDGAVKSRTAGANILMFAEPMRKTKMQLGACAVSWGDSDTRQVMYSRQTNCFERRDCPWDMQCGTMPLDS